MTSFLSRVLLGLLLLSSCRSSHEQERAERRQEILRLDQLNRERERGVQRDRALVRQYQDWMRQLELLDHADLGLPDPDGSLGPVTADATFCQRLPDTTAPDPAELIALYQRHAAALHDALYPETFAEYRAHYLAERTLTRLACLASLGTPALRQQFLRLLHDDQESVRYTAAIHAINRDLDRAAGWNTLETLARDGDYYRSRAQRLTTEHEGDALLPPGFDLNTDYERTLGNLRRDRKWHKPRTGATGMRGRL